MQRLSRDPVTIIMATPLSHTAAVRTARKIYAAAKVAGGEASLLAVADLARALRTSKRLAQSVGLRSANLDPDADDSVSIYNSEKLCKVFSRADRAERGALSFDDLGTPCVAAVLALRSLHKALARLIMTSNLQPRCRIATAVVYCIKRSKIKAKAAAAKLDATTRDGGDSGSKRSKKKKKKKKKKKTKRDESHGGGGAAAVAAEANISSRRKTLLIAKVDADNEERAVVHEQEDERARQASLLELRKAELLDALKAKREREAAKAAKALARQESQRVARLLNSPAPSPLKATLRRARCDGDAMKAAVARAQPALDILAALQLAVAVGTADAAAVAAQFAALRLAVVHVARGEIATEEEGDYEFAVLRADGGAHGGALRPDADAGEEESSDDEGSALALSESTLSEDSDYQSGSEDDAYFGAHFDALFDDAARAAPSLLDTAEEGGGASAAVEIEVVESPARGGSATRQLLARGARTFDSPGLEDTMSSGSGVSSDDGEGDGVVQQLFRLSTAAHTPPTTPLTAAAAAPPSPPRSSPLIARKQPTREAGAEYERAAAAKASVKAEPSPAGRGASSPKATRRATGRRRALLRRGGGQRKKQAP